MSQNLVIPPVPESREDKYLWIDKMVELGWTVVRACKMAGVPKISYYKLHKAKEENPADATGEVSGQEADSNPSEDTPKGVAS